MKICVYGAGAIGAYLSALLTEAGHDVISIARGPHLEAMRAHGLKLEVDGEIRSVELRCTDDPREAGPQDYVILTMKAHSVAPAVEQIATLLDTHTSIVTAQNGVPWWYFHGLEQAWANRSLECIDRGGSISNALGPERAIGCVVYPSCEIVEPGFVRHLHGNRFMLGEPDGSKSERVTALAEAFASAGMKAPVRRRIRDDIWFKLLGNATFNPISVLTGGTLEQMCLDTGVRDIARRVMTEARAVADRLGIRFTMEIEQRIDAAEKVGAHKTSMLQDFELGRALEIDALVGAVSELGRLVDVPTPTLDAVLALVRLRASTAADSCSKT